jgi:tetratricopeptide (TPR) repeat protein
MIIRLIGIALFALCLLPPHATAQRKSKRTVSATEQSSAGEADPRKRAIADRLFYDAATAKAQGKAEEALKLYAEVLSIDTSRSAAYHGTAEILLAQEKPFLAYPPAAHAYQIDPSNRWYAITLSEVYVAMRQPDKAVQVLKKCLENDADEFDLNVRLADTYLRLNKTSEALDIYDLLEKKSGLNDQIALQKYRVFSSTRDYTRGMAEMHKYIQASPEEARFYFMLYDLQTNAEQFDSAAATLELLLSVDPNNDQASFLLAEFYLKRHETEKAAAILTRALSNPLISLQAKLGFMDAVLPRYSDPFERPRIRKYLTLVDGAHPDSPNVMIYKARLKVFDKQIDSARVYYLQALDRDDSIMQGWIDLVNLDAGEQKWAELRKHTDAALVVFPGNLQFLYFGGVGSYQLKDYAASRASLERAMSLDPSDAGLRVQLLSLLGDTYHYLKEHALSDASYENVLKIDPSNAGALNNYAYFLSVRMVRLSDAREMISRVLRDPQHAENPSYLDTAGWIYYQLGEYKEARTLIERAYAQQQNAEITEHLGDVMFKLGDVASAVSYWQKAADTGDADADAAERLPKKIKSRSVLVQ